MLITDRFNSYNVGFEILTIKSGAEEYNKTSDGKMILTDRNTHKTREVTFFIVHSIDRYDTFSLNLGLNSKVIDD